MDRLTWQRTDVTNRLRFLDRPQNLRKLRLFGAACCRRIWDWLADPTSRNLVEVIERRADGHAADTELREAQAQAEAAFWVAAEASPPTLRPNTALAAEAYAALARTDAVLNAARAAWYCAANFHREAASFAASAIAPAPLRGPWGTQGWAMAYRAASRKERQEQKRLLDDLFGDLFLPVRFDPSWRTPPAVAIALAAYQERRWDDLPVLADALEEAGCADADVLGHLRGPGPHVRGCWAVDVVLGTV